MTEKNTDAVEAEQPEVVESEETPVEFNKDEPSTVTSPLQLDEDDDSGDPEHASEKATEAAQDEDAVGEQVEATEASEQAHKDQERVVALVKDGASEYEARTEVYGDQGDDPVTVDTAAADRSNVYVDNTDYEGAARYQPTGQKWVGPHTLRRLVRQAREDARGE